MNETLLNETLGYADYLFQKFNTAVNEKRWHDAATYAEGIREQGIGG